MKSMRKRRTLKNKNSGRNDKIKKGSHKKNLEHYHNNNKNKENN